MNDERGLVIRQPAKIAKTLHGNTASVTVRQNTALAGGYVEHLGIDEVRRIMEAARHGKYGDRNALMIALLFDSCLRISELLELTPERIDSHSNRILARNLKRHNGQVEVSWVGISESIRNQLAALAHFNKIGDSERMFPITRFRAHQILTDAMKSAGIVQPERTGRVHILRHSGALAVLERTGNIQLVRGQLRHSQINMSMTYLKTFARDEAVRAKANVDLWK